MIDNIDINTQSSIKIKSNKIIYFDPFKINSKTSDADIIFITHDHYDHFDITSINNIKNEKTILVIPKSIKSKIRDLDFEEEKIIEVIPNESYTILGYDVETIPSYNIDKPFHPQENKYVGYIINIDGKRIYVAGDTDVTKEAECVKCDIALIPIGGKFTCNYLQVAQLINKIKPEIVIPIHYGSIVGSLNDGEEFKKLIAAPINCVLKIK